MVSILFVLDARKRWSWQKSMSLMFEYMAGQKRDKILLSKLQTV